MNRRLLILLDDNFYLRSMRRDIYKKYEKKMYDHSLEEDAVKYYYGTIYFPISSIDICLERNKNRTRNYINNNNNNDVIVRCVPDHVIHRMNDKIEPPSLDNKW